jgi:hypothetical protein
MSTTLNAPGFGVDALAARLGIPANLPVDSSHCARDLGGRDLDTMPPSLIEQLADALNLAEASLLSRVEVCVGASPVVTVVEGLVAGVAAFPWGSDQSHCNGNGNGECFDPTYGHLAHEALDLPRLFDRDRQAALAADAAVQRPTKRRKSSGSTLSGSTMAFGFAIGLAVIAPTLWVSSAEKIEKIVERAGVAPTMLTPPMLTAAALEAGERAVATTASSRTEADTAFEEASRRLAVGDFIGARDYLRRAVAAGEDRARALLDALE